MPDKLEAHLAKLNLKLDRVKIIQPKETNKLSLRATLPPKPGEARPKQRTLSTKAPANIAGAKVAFARAKRLDAELIEGSFNWKDWDPKIAERYKPKTIGELSEQILELKRPQLKARGLRHKYQVPLSKLPEDAHPTQELLRNTIIEECTGYPTKWAAYKIAYGMLADLAGISHNLHSLGPKNANAVKPITPRDLPSDEQILEVWDGIDNQLYKILYARMACYGLRPHEAWKCEVAPQDKDEPICRVQADTKTGKRTGGRLILPLPIEWYIDMRPWLDFEPFNRVAWQDKDNEYLGHRISQFFERRKLPFNPYMLRHAWAVRSARSNLSTVVAAKMMGHSQAIHEKTYQQALGEEGMLDAWKKII